MENKEEYTPQRGDWILFMKAGQITIGEVLYVVKQQYYPWGLDYITTAGMTTSYIKVRKYDNN